MHRPHEVRLDIRSPYTLVFHGGPSDRTVFRSDAKDPAERQEAIGLLFLTEGGAVGTGLMSRSSGVSAGDIDLHRNVTRVGHELVLTIPDPPSHEYRVTSRDERDGRRFVRFEYRGLTP